MEEQSRLLLVEEAYEKLQLSYSRHSKGPLSEILLKPATRLILFAYLVILHLVVCLLAIFVVFGERRERSFYLDELNCKSLAVCITMIDC
jgi:hypothetical protein